MAIDLKDLSPPDRLVRYREEAAQSRRSAALASADADRNSYLDIAARWDAMAESLEKSMAPANDG